MSLANKARLLKEAIMKNKIKRRRYLIHFSSQFKYIAMSILPVAIIGIFGAYFLVGSGELIVKIQEQQLKISVSSLQLTIREIERSGYPPESVGKIRALKNELLALDNIFKVVYFDSLKKWSETKIIMLLVLVVVILLSAILSLLYSHRIAGPIFRLKRYIDMLAHGVDIPPVQVRNYDEFKEVAESLENLRATLKKNGMLSWGEPQSK